MDQYDKAILLFAQEIKNIKSSNQKDLRDIKKDIEELKNQLKSIKKYINDKIDESEERITSTQLKQNQLQLIETKKDVMSVIEKNVMPKLTNAVEYIKFQMQDGDEVVTDYRKKVMSEYNPSLPNTKLITNGHPKYQETTTSPSKQKFQKDTFAFTDDD